MTDALTIYRLLYVSQLAPGLSASVVGDILRQSRDHNRQAGVTGVLVFDGEHFGQLLEGQKEAVTELAVRIAADTRHTGFRTLYQGSDGRDRLFDDWQAGWAVTDALQVFLAVGSDAPPSLVDEFKQLSDGCDMA